MPFATASGARVDHRATAIGSLACCAFCKRLCRSLSFGDKFWVFLPYFSNVVLPGGLEPPSLTAYAPKAYASASFATEALRFSVN